MSVRTYKVNLKQQLNLLAPGILTLIGLIAVYLYFFKDIRNNKAFLIVLVFCLWFDILPAIALHIRYLIKNFGAVLTIDIEKRILTYESDKGVFTYSFDDISQLIYYRTYGKGSGMHSFVMYRYYTIVFNNGDKLNITCHMINKIEDTFEMLLRREPEKHFRLLNFI